MKKGFVLGALLIGASGTALARPELNAFINKPANSIPELIAQIKSDKQVADRFMRHFSMSKEEVLEYVGSLHLGTVQASGYYTIYSAPENGIIKAHISFFKKGTPAFVDSDGNAILRVKCANPFVRGPVKAYTTSNAEVEPSEFVPQSTPEPGASVVSDAIIATVPPTVVEVPDAPVTLKTTPINQSPSPFNVGSVIGLGGAAMFLNRHNTPPVVPEPASFLVVGLGMVALARRRKK